MHFETSPVPSNSRTISNRVSTQTLDDPVPDQTKQALPDIQNPSTSVAVGSALQGPHVAECPTHNNNAEVLSQGSYPDRTMLGVGEGLNSDISRVYSDASSISESAFASILEGKVGKFDSSSLFVSENLFAYLNGCE